MLELVNVKKFYQAGETEIRALDSVSIRFRQNEFVAILGPSGSGKTTMLNVIGGLDTYDSGDMLINGKSTKDFKEQDWDAYRNNAIGFVFQSYNLIGHLDILTNVEMGMTLSGVDKKVKKQKAEKALERVGLKAHIHKKPSQLSGGQMQRVAIARAIANDPEILLCDEPTGALDSETSLQIMELIKELSNEKLLIMVTHNAELAHQYANRIVSFEDGKIFDDTMPFVNDHYQNGFDLVKTHMSFWTALKLSFNNIRTKKFRTFLTAFASSIGIISIGIVLALSNGFQKQIKESQTKTMSQFPITIAPLATNYSASIQSRQKPTFSNKKVLLPEKSSDEKVQHTNVITQKYVDYIENINPNYSNNISFSRSTQLNLVRKKGNDIIPVTFSNQDTNSTSTSTESQRASMTGIGVSTFPIALDKSKTNFLKDNYKLLSGSFPNKSTDVVVVLDGNNETNIHALENLGFDVKEGKAVDFSKFVGTEIQAISNNDYYKKLPTGTYIPTTSYKQLWNKTDNESLKIVGIIRVKKNASMDLLAPGIAYSDLFVQNMIAKNKVSQIVKDQKSSKTNILTGANLKASEKTQLISYLGGSLLPSNIMIYPNSFKTKEKVLDYLDNYNKGKTNNEKIVYTDLASTMTSLTGGIMDAITYVLIAFAAISLITSMIMIAIIIYTSVLERTKEIGVLKALGARKKDVTRVFDAETFLLGLGSGILGIGIAWLSTFPINHILYKMTELKNVSQLNPIHAIILIAISTILTMLDGHIPAKMAAKKDAATALRAD